jgi:hypothetical protein
LLCEGVLFLDWLTVLLNMLHDKAHMIQKSADVALDNGVICLSWAASPTTCQGPDDNLPTASKLGALQHVTCYQCTHHRQVIAEFWAGKRCSARVEALGTCLERLPHLEIWACHGPTQHLHFPLQPDWTTPPPLSRIHHYIWFVSSGLWLMLRHGMDA